jgi:hypothetical protein
MWQKNEDKKLSDKKGLPKQAEQSLWREFMKSVLY